ncbi:MAG: RNase H-like domain-containing protein, partial [Clostridium sp.]|uniref:RNase H-like domain-containing protein n=1 Tax=Clostridium sp. TaxID=1506 RepID=UPI003F2C45E3
SNRKQLMKLLGVINWFRDHIPNLSVSLSCISNKLSGKRKFVWSNRDTQIVSRIVKTVKQQITLHHPDITKEFILSTDASDEGMGAVLTQEGKIVGIYSYKFKKAELNYTVTEKELLAIIKALQHFKTMLMGSIIKVKTDHRNLLYISKCDSNRAQRWKILLDEYNVNLEHISGKDNTGADTLSRCFTLINKEHQNSNFLQNLPFALDLTARQTTEGRICIPKNKVRDFINFAHHDFFAHPGMHRLYSTLKKAFKVKNMMREIKRITKNCTICQQNKNSRSNYAVLSGAIFSTEPFSEIAIDIMGPIDPGRFKNSQKGSLVNLLVVVDLYSKWTEIYPLTKTTSAEIKEHLTKQWFKKHGKPKRLLSDQGRQFISAHFLGFLKNEGIKHTTSSAYNPTGNSVVERMNQTIGNTLRCLKHLTFDEALSETMKSICLLQHQTLGHSPFEIVKGKNPLNPYLTSKIDRNAILRRTKDRNLHDLRRINSNRVPHRYRVGDKVFVKAPTCDKLDPRWKGPFRVVKVKLEHNYVIIKKGSKQFRINFKRLKPFLNGGRLSCF